MQPHQVQQACIRSQLHLVAPALALHCTPALKGFVSAASAFAFPATATACIRMEPRQVQQACIRSQLHLLLRHLPCTAHQP